MCVDMVTNNTLLVLAAFEVYAMRMRICPGSLWLAYTLERRALVANMLPSGLKLANSALLRADGDRESKLLMNAYRLRSQYMNGHRIDVQVLAQDTLRKTFHLVVLDCYSDTMMWDPINGVKFPNAGGCHLRMQGDLYKVRVAAKNPSSVSLLSVKGTKDSSRVPISWRFSVESNRVCYYANSETKFPMSFDEGKIAEPVHCLLRPQVATSLWSEFRSGAPTHVFIHGDAMDFDVEVNSRMFRFRLPK